VTPQFDEVFLGVLVCLLSHIQALEYLGDIAHVENVMGVSGGRQELFRHSVKQLDGGDGQVFAESLDFFREVVELEGGKGFKNPLEIGFRGNGVVDHVELGKHTIGQFGTTTTGLAHGGEELKVAHVVLDNLGSVEPVAVVHPLTE
jgi:hypothetical protein